MNRHTENERTQWMNLVAEQEKSGLAQGVFCRERNLSLNTFVYYRSHYLKRHQKRRCDTKKMVNPFVEISMSPAVLEPFRLSFPQGISLTLPQHFDDQQLAKLLEVLRAC